MENIKATAWTFLIEHHLNTFPIDVLSLNKLNLAFKIRSYEEAKNLIAALELEEYADHHMGFTISEQGIATICYDNRLSFSHKDFVIAHEIGHVALKHTIDGYLLGKSLNPKKQNEQEKEADIFALALLAPAPVLTEMKICTPSEISRITRLSIKKAEKAAIEIMNENTVKKTGLEIDLIHSFRISILKYTPPTETPVSATEKRTRLFPANILFILCAAIVAINIGFAIGTTQNTNYKGLPQTQNQMVIPTSAPAASSEQINGSSDESVMVIDRPSAPSQDNGTNTAIPVYITKAGVKYHLPSCPHILNKTNLQELTPNQAEQKGYEPCKTCRPNE